jgi:RNA recognition motif-containing protein
MKLYVGNLAPAATGEELSKAFGAYGIVDSVSLPGEHMGDGRPSGTHRGFGFVEMSSREEGAAAIAGMHGKAVHGLALVVKVAKPARTPHYVS